MDDERSSFGRRETDEERQDRKFADLLQELRVMQTGAQLTAGFLLTLPFQSRFEELNRFQVGLYLVMVILAALTTAFVLGPVAVHRRLSGQHVKERVIVMTHRMVYAALVAIALLLVGMVLFIVDVVIDWTWAVALAAAVAVVLATVLVVVPMRLTGND